MNNAKFTYRTTLMSSMVLIAMFIYSVAFIGCDTAQDMAGNVVQPTTPTTPPAEETTPTTPTTPPAEETTPPTEETTPTTSPTEETTPTVGDPTEPGTVGRGGGTPTEDNTGDSDDNSGGGFNDDPNVDP